MKTMKNQSIPMNDHRKEKDLFTRFLKGRQLKSSAKRDHVVDVFFRQHKHITAEDLYQLAKNDCPRLGFTTVYRTLKLLCESGLCVSHKFNDTLTYYEHLYGHPHHDHLICTECDRYVEIVDESIEKSIHNVYKNCQFKAEFHRLELYGICPHCLNKD